MKTISLIKRSPLSRTLRDNFQVYFANESSLTFLDASRDPEVSELITTSFEANRLFNTALSMKSN